MISPIEEKKLRAELAEIETELDAAAAQMEETAAFGDFRENEPFHIAKAKYVALAESYQQKKTQLEEPVGLPIGNSITVGRLLKIVFLGIQNSHGEFITKAQEEMLLLFSEEGDPVVQGILSVGCELGRLLHNGREGTYVVSSGSESRVYDVRLFNGDPEEYFLKFPASRKKKIERLLRGELI